MGSSRIGEFELLVLLAALRLGPEEAYAVPLADEIEARTARTVRRSSVYTTLRRLEEKGLVTTRLGDSLPERGGKARRLIAVTGEGVEAVRGATSDLRSMWEGLEEVVGGAA